MLPEEDRESGGEMTSRILGSDAAHLSACSVRSRARLGGYECRLSTSCRVTG